MEETLNREEPQKVGPCASSVGDQDEVNTETVSLSNLSELTNFPEDFLKKELLLKDNKEISIEDLRAKVLHYLDDTFELLKK